MPLTLHFLNVGHGDCTVIEHPDGEISIVDINNGGQLDPTSYAEVSDAYGYDVIPGLSFKRPLPQGGLKAVGYNVNLTNPIEFIQSRYPGKRPFRYIQTHPDLDHMRGLRRLVDSGLAPVNFWGLPHEKVPDFSGRFASDRHDWDAYQQLCSGSLDNFVVQPLRGARNRFFNLNADGSVGGHGIQILSPCSDVLQRANESKKWNEMSYVLRLEHAGTSVILGGDAESMAWQKMVELYGASLKCDILKASHHGRESGYFDDAVSLMKPLVTVVSVGKKPETDSSYKYRRHCENVWSTRWKGNISLTIRDDGVIEHNCEYQR